MDRSPSRLEILAVVLVTVDVKIELGRVAHGEDGEEQ
jgi:hypothetical protein